VQGASADCLALLQRLEDHFSITRVKKSEGPASGAYPSFEIRY
jgi:hypothetical protein